MNDRNQQRINEAAEQFADAVRESYRAVAERGASAQELNAQVTQQFFNTVINNLRTQAGDAREMTQQLADQQQRAREAGQALTQESVQAYMEFVNSAISYWQGGARAAERGAKETQRETTTATPPPPAPDSRTSETQSIPTEAPSGRQADAELPLEDYDSLSVEQISQRLDDLSAEKIRQLREYETQNKSRSTLLQRLDERIEAASGS